MYAIRSYYVSDWMDRYQLLIDLGNEQEPLEEKYKTEQNLIEGCQSRVWLQADEVDGKLIFKAESDALIVKGIIALLIKVVSGHTPDEILSSDLYFIEKIGLKEHLSPTRSNGLLSMVKQIRMYALAYKAKERKLVITSYSIHYTKLYDADLKDHAPRIETLTIPKEFIGAIIGPGGKIIV